MGIRCNCVGWGGGGGEGKVVSGWLLREGVIPIPHQRSLFISVSLRSTEVPNDGWEKIINQMF